MHASACSNRLTGSDRLYLFAGTQTDLQSDISSPDLYGAGKLDASVLAGVSEIDVLVEHGATTIFRAGGLIRISDQTSVGSGGNAEYKVIDTGGVSVAGDVVTLTLTSALANDYSSTNTFVSSIYETAEVKGSAGNKVVTSTLGTFDETLVTVGNLGSLYQTVTLTFTSATAFTATSDEITFTARTLERLAAPSRRRISVSAPLTFRFRLPLGAVLTRRVIPWCS
jgi:hypothetical protein